MVDGRRFTWRPSGSFSLAEAKRFLIGFPSADTPADGEGVDWAFLSDEGEPVAVRVRQARTQVTVDVLEGAGDLGRLRAQVGRMFALDHDGIPYDAIDDPVLNRLRAERPGLRPVLFLTRGAGHPDVFARREPLLARLMAQHYGVADAVPAVLAGIADAWRPRRTWASFLLKQSA